MEDINENDRVEKENELKDIKDRIEYLNKVYSRAKDETMKTSIKKSMAKLAARRTVLARKMNEAQKPDFIDADKDGNEKEPMKKAVKDKVKNSITLPDDVRLESASVDEVKGNHRPGWMLRADPALAKKVKEVVKKNKEKNKLLGKKVSEDSEQIDELSVDKMLKYSDAAEKDRERLNDKWSAGTASKKEKQRVLGREEGEARAANKVKKKTGKYPDQHGVLSRIRYSITKEETEIEESAFVVTWSDLDYKVSTKKFMKSKNDSPDKAERDAREFAKKLEKQNNIRTVKVRAINEEEQIEELYRDTVRSYMKKAHQDEQNPDHPKKEKRAAGVKKALNRLNSRPDYGLTADQKKSAAQARAMGYGRGRGHYMGDSIEHSEGESIEELSSEKLGEYKKKASADATAADAKGDFKKGDKRYSGIIKATKKQFANDIKKHANEEVETVTEQKHRVAVTVSEPDHPAVSMRKATKQKFVRVTAADEKTAVEKAKAHYKKSGYKVHGAEHAGMVNETHLKPGTKIKDGKEELTVQKPVGDDKYVVKAKEPK